MARVEGLLKAVGAEGKFGDFVTYRLHGKLVMRRIGKLEKEAYAEAPCFEQLRQNQSEFGLASQISKTLRLALGAYEKRWCDRYCSGRLTGRIRKILQQGEGAKGQRSFELRNLSLLNQFPLDKTRPSKAFLTTAGTLSQDKQKAIASLSYNTQQLEYWCGGPLAKDRQLVLGIIILSRVYFDGGYRLAQPEWHGRASMAECTGNEPQVRVKLPKLRLPQEVGWIGVGGMK